MRTLSAEQIQSSHRLIDVRGPREFAAERIAESQNIPLGELEAHVESLAGQENLVLVCASGLRARKAQEILERRGLNACVLEGGVREWVRCGLPVQKVASPGLSLERQVRIVAGTLVAVGGFMGVFVHPYWALLAGFVGCGLVFAGITDTCGMALLLAKLPYNRAGGASCCQQSSPEDSACTLETKR